MTLFSFIEDSLEVFYTQPDTTLCKERQTESKKEKFKFYRPDGIKNIVVIPFVYIRISRPCKALHKEFAHRHYKVCGYGLHLVSDDVDEGSILDNSIFLSPETLITDSPAESFTESSITCSKTRPYMGFESFDSAIERTSRYITLRVGDYITLDLPKIAELTIADNETQIIDYKDIEVSIIG